jgi:hypothetical protein
MVDLSTVTGMLTFAGTTGVITALLNQAFGIGRDLWREHVKRKSDDSKREAEAGYLALRLAALLEGYAYSCWRYCGYSLETKYKRGMPPLPPFPEEMTGWHAIDLKLAGRALDLRNHLAGSELWANGVFDEDDDLNDVFDFNLTKDMAERGKEAWDIAKDLRSRHGLPPFVPVRWDYAKNLEERIQKAEEELARGEDQWVEYERHRQETGEDEDEEAI